MTKKPSYDQLEKRIKQLEQEAKKLKQIKNRLIEAYEIIERSPAVAFLWKNLEGWPVEFVSENVMELFGYSADDFVSGRVLYTKVVHPDDLKRVAGEVANFSIGKGQKRFTHEPYRIVTKDGKIKWIVDRTYIRRDENGKITHYQGIVLDITKRKQADELVRDLSQMLMQAQERERQMISCELHDSIAQDLSTLKLYCNRLFEDQSSPESDIKGSPADVSKLIDLTITTVRDLAYNLRPPSLDHMGLVHALEVFCEEFTENNDIMVDFQAAGIHESTLNSDTQINIYRLVTEGLNNIRKHAAASEAMIRLVGAYPNIILRIEDNGKGFDVKERERSIGNEKKMGLRSMKERVNLLQGQMSIHSQLNKGTKIVIKLPLKDKQKWIKKSVF
ncbi:MAG: PAS domain-containing protein [Desulfobacula sp.]|nr:PAS domain-containing protein [Desulfobacula sp.]